MYSPIDAIAAWCSAEGISSSSSLSLSLSDHDSHPGAPIIGFSRRVTGCLGFRGDICLLLGMVKVVVYGFWVLDGVGGILVIYVLTYERDGGEVKGGVLFGSGTSFSFFG